MLAEGMSTHLRRSGFVRTSVLAMGALFALGAVLVSPGLLSRSGAQQAEGFSADERQRLADGRLVVRRSQRRRGQLRLIGGNSWQVVDQPVEVTWRAMCDEASYRRMARLRRRSGREQVTPRGTGHRAQCVPARAFGRAQHRRC